ncbi:uncharacterized protein Pyn_35606 [Prunus yedoensis var. nudiflora]|uniref:Uncharacterized protein n=1 Tax=Prunus yedoensis var. nudiflora TaxID=2094558 RepID=A0A314XRP5_PRUYE|nr:uncharacterized protein Pyn_35606 [Prunus yedoensis var. nudiflora]
MDQHKIDDNLRYLAEFCGYSVDLRCQLPDKGVQNADTGGYREKNEDEDDFSFTCTNPDGSPISTDDIFQNGQIRPVFPIFNQDLLFADADDDYTSRARRATASSSSLWPPLKKLFFEELDTPTSATLFYNSGGELGS